MEDLIDRKKMLEINQSLMDELDQCRPVLVLGRVDRRQALQRELELLHAIE